MIGAQILNYRIVEKLGDGGMGSVYKAVDVMLERDVALKFLRPELAEQPDLVERFRSEAVVLARLMHQNIASLFGLHRHGNDFFMAMEYVPGKTVEALLKQNGRFSVAHATQIAGHVLNALDYAHRHGVVHRDIKAANIIVTPSGSVKVMDFGIARVLGTERRTRVGFVVGTIGYMAPEQIQGLDVDGRADIYAVGVALYEMLTGRMPFQGDTEFAVMQAQVQQMPPPPRTFADVPEAVEACVLRALAKQPAERFQTAVEFNGALRASLRMVTAVTGGSGQFARPSDETREFKSDPALRARADGGSAVAVPSPASGASPAALAPATPAAGSPPPPDSTASDRPLAPPPPASPAPPAPTYTLPPYTPPRDTPPPFRPSTPVPAVGSPPSASGVRVPVRPPAAPDAAPQDATSPIATPAPTASEAPPIAAVAPVAPQPVAPRPVRAAATARPPKGRAARVAALAGVLAIAAAGGTYLAWRQWQAGADASQPGQAGGEVVAGAADTSEQPPAPPATGPAAPPQPAPAAPPVTMPSPATAESSERAAPGAGGPRPRRNAAPPAVPLPAAATPVESNVDPLPAPVAPEPEPLRPVLPPAMFGNVKWMRVDGSRIREIDVFLQLDAGELRLLDRRTRSTLGTIPFAQVSSALYSQGKRPQWRTDLGPAPASTSFDDTVRTFHYVAFQGPSQFLLVRVDRTDLTRLRDELRKRSSIDLDIDR